MIIDLPKNITELIDQSFPGSQLRLFLDDKWGSDQPEYRTQIRKALVSEVFGDSDLTHEKALKFLDLNELPTHDEIQISIAHCKGIGGWSQAHSKVSIGFDVEESARVDEKLVQRVSKAEELRSAPGSPYIWTAKEASFKALSFLKNLRTMSQLETAQWIPLDHLWWHYTVFCDGVAAGKGVSGPYKAFHLSLFKSSNL